MTNTSSNIKYKEYNNLLLTSLATLGIVSALSATSEIPVSPVLHEFNLQTSQNIVGDYNSLKLTTQIENVVPNSLAYSLKDEIIEKTSSLFGYKILEIYESSLTDEEGTFKIYTFFLDLETRDYSILLEQEWEINEVLGLYEKNTILRFV